MASIAKMPDVVPSASTAPASPSGSTATSSSRSTQIRATKIGVWKIGNNYFEDFESTEREVRRLVVLELLAEESPEAEPFGGDEDIASWVSVNWDLIEKRVKEALAGS